MMATVPHVTSGLRLRKFQADGFLLTRVYHPSNSLIRNDHSLYLQLEQALSAVMGVEVQGKFYVGEVVAQTEVVAVDIVEDLLHLMSAKVVVVAEPQVASRKVPFQTYWSLNMEWKVEVLMGEVAVVQLTLFHDDLSSTAMWQFLGVVEDLHDNDVWSPETDGMMVNLNCLHGSFLDSLLLAEKEHREVEQQVVILAHAYCVHESQEVGLCFEMCHSQLVS